MTFGPRVVDRTVEHAIFDLWRACHAAALAVCGGALGCCAGAIVPVMINCPPQHGQGSASTRGGSSELLWLSSSWRLWSGVLAPSSCRISGDIDGTIAISEEAIVADAVQALWQDMDQEPADELSRCQGHGRVAALAFGAVILDAERDTGFCDLDIKRTPA